MSNPKFREGLSAAVERRPADFAGAAAAQSNESGPSNTSQGSTE
jgi:hypothetical protein